MSNSHIRGRFTSLQHISHKRSFLINPAIEGNKSDSLSLPYVQCAAWHSTKTFELNHQTEVDPRVRAAETTICLHSYFLVENSRKQTFGNLKSMEFLTGICNFYLLLHILVREVCKYLQLVKQIHARNVRPDSDAKLSIYTNSKCKPSDSEAKLRKRSPSDSHTFL